MTKLITLGRASRETRSLSPYTSGKTFDSQFVQLGSPKAGMPCYRIATPQSEQDISAGFICK